MGCFMCFSLAILAVSVLVGGFMVRYKDEVELGMNISNGYGAKIGCSVVFVAGRDLSSALGEEFIFPPIRLFSRLEVDAVSKCVEATSRLFPRLKRRACWKSERLGCALEHPKADPTVSQTLVSAVPGPTKVPMDAPFPLGDGLEDSDAVEQARKAVDMKRVRDIADAHFSDSRLHARALILIKNGQIVYERYGEGFGAGTRFLGWSMTKSWTNVLVGLRILQGGIPDGLDTKLGDLLPEFQDDERGTVRLEEALRMVDGIDLDEYYFPTSAATRMLFIDPALVQNHLGIRAPRNASTCFRYSSHSTNVASKLLRATFATHQEYLRFPVESFFDQIGMRSAVMETDPDGTFIGSSFGWATARDWARFGLFLLQDGVWNGTRFLPEGWMEFSTSPTPTSRGVYGAHFWGNLGPVHAPGETDVELDHCDERFSSRINPPRDWIQEAFPRGTFIAHGFEEQAVVVAPKSEVVVVRLGQTNPLLSWGVADFYRSILEAAGAPHNESQARS